eukprot:SAG31_NODE_3947_length_3725_cov_24.626034_1_plen_928_part_10
MAGLGPTLLVVVRLLILFAPVAGQDALLDLQSAAMGVLCPALLSEYQLACSDVDVEVGEHCAQLNSSLTDAEAEGMLASNMTRTEQRLFNCSREVLRMAEYDGATECEWDYTVTGNVTHYVHMCENYTVPVEVVQTLDPRACAMCLLDDGVPLSGNVSAGQVVLYYIDMRAGVQYVVTAEPGAIVGIRTKLRLLSSGSELSEDAQEVLATSDSEPPTIILKSADARRSRIVWLSEVATNLTLVVGAQIEGQAGSFEISVTTLPRDQIWVGANRFGPTKLHSVRDAMIRADPHDLQENSKHANPTMSSPDILVWPQQVFVNEGDVFEYTVVLTHPPGSTDANGIYDEGRDLVQIWLTSSREVLQEYAPGKFAEFQGHRTQLLIETDLGTSEDYWMHNPWDGSVSGDFKTSMKADGTGEARLDFNSTNWHIPQTVRVTARQDDVFEPRVNRRGQQAYVHHRVVTPECNSPVSPFDDPQKATSADDLNATAWMNAPTCGDPHYNGLIVTDVVVSIEDDDPAVVLQDINDPIPIEGGDSANISLKLASEPMYDVTVSLFSGPVRHPDVPPQVTFHAINSALPGIAQYRFTPLDWNTWRTFEIKAVDDNVDEWSYNKKFRDTEIGYKIDSNDYYYRNNGTSCLPLDVHQVRHGTDYERTKAQIVPRDTQCVCVREDPDQVVQYRPDQYNALVMQCGAIVTPIDNNYRFVNISLTSCTAIEGSTNCDYTVRLNTAPGFNPWDWERDLPSTVVVHLREEAETEAEALREHELFITEWASLSYNVSNDTEAVAEPENAQDLDLVELGLQSIQAQQDGHEDNSGVCHIFNETVWPLINESCKVRNLATHGGTSSQDYVEASGSFKFAPHCSNKCAGLVVPYFEQCAIFNEPDNLEILHLYKSCGGKIFDGEMMGSVWDEVNTDGRGGRKTFGKSLFH